MSARRLAYDILKKASIGSTYSNIALDNAIKRNELTDADRGLITAIVMGVTERRLTLDCIIDALAAKPDKVDADTRVLLRMGIFQLLFLDRIPEYAAVNETVSLAPRRSVGFVNAILRSLLRKKKSGELEALFPVEDEDRIGYLSVKYSFPEAICQRFADIYGYERAKSVLEFFNRTPRLTLRINPLKISREGYLELLVERGIVAEISQDVENAVILDDAAFSSLPGFDEGYFFVQDLASQLCVEAVGARPGELVIDTCSCPGSKSFGMAIGMQNEGRICSFDLHKSKLSLIESGAVRLGIDIIETDVRDGRVPDEELLEKADRVLCDVPCSGLGVIAKKPEIRYKDLDEAARLPEIQYAILESSSRYVKVGGVLAYSTCTVLPEENADNVARFLSEHGEFEPCDFKVGKWESQRGMLSLSPDLDKTDGFFIAKMKRVK